MPPTTGAPAGARTGARTGAFVRLKLRILRNGLRGRTGRVLLFIAGALFGLYLAAIGFLLFAASTTGDAQVRLMAASYGGAALVLGAVLLPLVWFGIDDTLDPARFALLPLSRWGLVTGLLAAALVGVPAVALLLGTAGLLVPAASHGGIAAAAVQTVGLVGGLILCVAAGRAVTSAFATMLRSRRVRDLAGILLALLAALIAPLQFAVVSAARQADWDRLAAAAEVVGWTPLGAPYTSGLEVAAGRPVAAVAKLLITAAAVAGLLWWWSRSVESAMVGAATAGPARAGGAGGAVAQLFPRSLPGLPVTGAGALVARAARYWWRDARRRANLVTIAVIGVLVPVLVTFGGDRVAIELDGETLPDVAGSPVTVHLTLLFVGAFAASVLANELGFDGTSYATNVTIGVPGRRELRTRAAAHAVATVPVLVIVATVAAVLLRDPATGLAALGLMLAGYGTGLAVNLHLAVIAAYPLPESSNPFATTSGAGMAKSLLALAAIIATYAIATPVLLLTLLLDGHPLQPWLVLPAGLGYGLVIAALGTALAGPMLDRRAPELLATITPRR